MNVTAVAIIAIIFGCTIAMVSMIIKYKNESKIHSQDNHELESEIAKLKERVATLEKIVTDENYNLKKEFEKL